MKQIELTFNTDFIDASANMTWKKGDKVEGQYSESYGEFVYLSGFGFYPKRFFEEFSLALPIVTTNK